MRNRYRWFRAIENETCEDYEKELGCEVKSVTIGDILVGYEDSVDEEGNKIRICITKPGIELELEKETPEILARADRNLIGFKREGGIEITEVVEDLISQVANLKARVTELEGF